MSTESRSIIEMFNQMIKQELIKSRTFYNDNVNQRPDYSEKRELDVDLRQSRAIAGVARGAAIPSGRTLTRKEMLDLVDGLFACQEPDRDPWGRSTLATFDKEAVEARFR